ncbi:gfo/Idh/MocA family oxidoreductase [Phnomibacter ginsenosidimutans]|uniref:Gfo/Idh/MocA family oxidoreductase n=2 Tax=Phnomibacter ginsenosidimutans TaxID=2676868 RepID=A0A6I6GBH2_9BACT|nr:gfo/Idh/MocA family oxidoreductase [Phnomibacter ginsenosidimutans]
MHQRNIANAQLPVYIIGAGGIVNAAHLPAYRLAGFNVQGICDIDVTKAQTTAAAFGIPHVFECPEEMLQQLPTNAVVDIAVPGPALIPLLQQIPDGTPVLLQKPMGENMQEAQQILEICRSKKLNAAVNFQLRYAPFILEVKKMLQSGQLGEINDIEINVSVYTPWHLWDFLMQSPRVEILYHSIHYVDLIRHMLGNPQTIYAKSTRHPSMPKLAAVRSNIIMDYGDMIRGNIFTNHCHNYGKPKQHSYIKFEGSKGAVLINFGALINYPRGEADSFEYVFLQEGQEPVWQERKIEGSWFPHAFIGSMEQLMLSVAGGKNAPDNSVEDCIHTMACVEAAYASSEQGGIQPRQFL